MPSKGIIFATLILLYLFHGSKRNGLAKQRRTRKIELDSIRGLVSLSEEAMRLRGRKEKNGKP